MRSADHTSQHTQLVHEILTVVGSRPDVRLWPQKFLQARVGKRYISTGIRGMADLSGMLINGRRLEIEVKTGDAVPTPEQRRWREMVLKFGGVYVEAHSVEDVLVIIEAALERRRA